MVSIAMATYNGEKYIYKQLNSLFTQTKKPDEVIIIDDASQDKTVEIVENFIKDRQLSNWFFSKNEKNLGVIGTFFKAIKQTKGEYIFLCDQDDIWINNKIEVMYNIFKQKPKVQVLNSSFEFINEADSIINDKCKFGYCNHNLINKHISKDSVIQIHDRNIIMSNISPGCTIAFTSKIKELYIKNKINYFIHDWSINIIGAMLDGLYFVNIPTIFYRIHSSNAIGLEICTKVDVWKFRKNLNDRISRIKKQNENYNLIKKIILSVLDINEKEQKEKYLLYINRETCNKKRLEYLLKLDMMKCLKFFSKRRYYGKDFYRMLIMDIIYILKVKKTCSSIKKFSSL